MQVSDGGVDGDFVFPLKFDPHRAEFGVGAGSGNDVVHDVDVDCVQHHDICGRRCVVNCKRTNLKLHEILAGNFAILTDISKNNSVLGG